MRQLTKLYLIIPFSLFLFFTCFSKEKNDKPNIIMILVDDMGYSDLGCYGGEIETPNLDKLAKKGIRFTQMHNTAKCFPSRACLLTGVYAQQCGMGVQPKTFTNSISLGDLLRNAGYRTLLSGKNHSQLSLYNFGFDRVYEFWGGATNHFNPGLQRAGEAVPIFKGGPNTWNVDDKSYNPYSPEKDFYSTDYFTKNAISYLEEYKNDSKPFFLYLAYTAPHDPLMAWPKDIAKYRGKYKEGYQVIRKARYEKMLELGMVDPKMKLSEQTSIEWNSLTEEEKDSEDLKMAIYAAMIDCVDQNIGRLINKLKELGKLDNTLIMFASDNGCSAENAENKVGGTGEHGTLSQWTSLQKNWANVSNTPYRYSKRSSYEGGICTPYIVSWPEKLKNGGSINNQLFHFVDVMPTLKEITGASYPTKFRGEEIVPMQGESFLPLILGKKLKEREKPVYWQWTSGKAIRLGKYKAVFEGKDWAMYNMTTDRNETNDLKEKFPAKFEELMSLYQPWDKEYVKYKNKKINQ